MSESPGVLTRREFPKDSLAGALVVGSGVQSAASAEVAAPNSGLPWYRRAYRRGQTNITENDPDRYGIPWWREPWKGTQGRRHRRQDANVHSGATYFT